MKYTQITYQKNFHTDIKDRFLMETIILVAEIGDNEDPIEASVKANKLLQSIHVENNPQLFTVPATQSTTVPPYYDEAMRGTQTKIVEPAPVVKSIPIKKLSATEVLIRDIENCTELPKPNGLLSYEKVSSSNPTIKAAYDLQLLKLKN